MQAPLTLRKIRRAKQAVFDALADPITHGVRRAITIPEKSLKPLGFFYGRFSTTNQKMMSIEAQLAVAEDLAASLGIGIPLENQYFDAAKSGRSGVRREGWQALMKRIEAGEVGYLFADEQSRLFRGEVEVQQFKGIVARHNMTLLARDIDTRVPGWEFMFSIRGAVNALELITTRGRIKRSQAENAKRGYAGNAACYGYNLRAHMSADGTRREHSTFEINDEQAKIVRRIYAERRQGKTLVDIARDLSSDGVQSPGSAKKGASRIFEWRMSAIQKVLDRAIYKGVYQYADNVKLMPNLEIVNPDEWAGAQLKKSGPRARHIRGGGKEWYAGLTRHTCGCRLSIVGRTMGRINTPMLCPHCRMVGAHEKVSTLEINTGVMQLRASIEMALKYYFTEARLAECRAALKAKGQQSNESRIAEVKRKLERVSAQAERVARALRNLGDDGGMEELEEQMMEIRDEKVQLHLELSRLEADGGGITKSVLAKQLLTEPSDVCEHIFSGNLKPYEMRVMLARIFAEIVYEGRAPKWWNRPPYYGTKRTKEDIEAYGRQKEVCLFLLTLNLGELFAATTGTATVPLDEIQMRIMVERYKGQMEFTAHLLECPVTNSPELPLAPSMHHVTSVSRATKRDEALTDLDLQRSLYEERTPPQCLHEKRKKRLELGRSMGQVNAI
jgi:DNA invertase Pin-like site-specific DNA recombinase